MARQDIERQKLLEPDRVKYAAEQIAATGCRIVFQDDKCIEFMFNNHICRMFPYSGWHSGKTIVDGRGIKKLLKQIRK